VDLRLQPK